MTLVARIAEAIQWLAAHKDLVERMQARYPRIPRERIVAHLAMRLATQ